MTIEQFLVGSLTYLVAMVISAPIARRLGLGSVLGFLLAGVLIGPWVLRLVGTEGSAVKNFGEFGVIMMLFLVGLELEAQKLWDLKRQIFGLGFLQMLLSTLLVGGAAFLVLGDWRVALCCGLVLAMSSTAIVLQSLEERGLLKSPVGQSVFSVLLFQDVSVIPVLAFLPLIALSSAGGNQDHSLIAELPVYLRVICVLLAVSAVAVGGRYLTRPLFRMVAETGAREIFVAFALLLVVAITLLMSFVGLSAALGTFLAGVVLADSEYRHELEQDLQPFKGLLMAIFFLAVGAGVDFSVVIKYPAALLGALGGFLALKSAVIFLLGRYFGMQSNDASRFALSLAGGGEFAFVLIGICTALGLFNPETAGFMTAIIALSMAMTPLLIKFDDRVLQPRFDAQHVERPADVITEKAVDVIIAGHGRFGMVVGRMLTAQGFKLAVLEHDTSQVDVLRKFGFKVYYGDASRLDLLEAAGAKQAKILVIAIDDREKATEIAKMAKAHFPQMEVFARAYDRVHATELMKAGFPNVYREMFGSSLDVSRDVLIALGRSAEAARRQIKLFRDHDEDFLHKSLEIRDDDKALVDLARESRAEIARVFAGDRKKAKSDVETPRQ